MGVSKPLIEVTKGYPMGAERKRKNKLEFYVTDEEKNFILEKMKAANIDNLSAYLRKIAIDGKIEIYDLSEMKELNYNLRKIGVNINQITKRINETNSVFREDLRDIQNKQEEIWQLQKHIISTIKNNVSKDG